MGARTEYRPGTFCWVQLATSDLEAAGTFYGAVLGWEAEEARGTPEEPSLMLRVGEHRVAGMFQPPAERSIPPHWPAYFSSAGLDESARRITEQGGHVIVPATPIPSGRILMAADPQGAVFALFEGEVDP